MKAIVLLYKGGDPLLQTEKGRRRLCVHSYAFILICVPSVHTNYNGAHRVMTTPSLIKMQHRIIRALNFSLPCRVHLLFSVSRRSFSGDEPDGPPPSRSYEMPPKKWLWSCFGSLAQTWHVSSPLLNIVVLQNLSTHRHCLMKAASTFRVILCDRKGVIPSPCMYLIPVSAYQGQGLLKNLYEE